MFKRILKNLKSHKFLFPLVFSFVLFFALIPLQTFAEISHPHFSTDTHAKSSAKSLLVNRVGISFAGAPWALGALFSYDRLALFPDPNWSLGAEIGLYGLEFTVMPRALRWENINMSGFYVGPKAFLSNGEYKHNEFRTFFGIGAEGGWLYRFPENFDVGAGIDLSLTSDGPWGSVKITAGYLF